MTINDCLNGSKGVQSAVESREESAVNVLDTLESEIKNVSLMKEYVS